MDNFTQTLQAQPIRTGCEWRLKFKYSSVNHSNFEPTVNFNCQIRETPNGQLLATLTTGNGGVIRVDEKTIELRLPDKESRDWTMDSVVLDVVRGNAIKRNLGFVMMVPVRRSFTRLQTLVTN